MNSDFPPEASDVCLEMLEITTTSAERVRECAESDEGLNLLHDIGLETASLDPALTGVPWLLFNEVSRTLRVNVHMTGISLIQFRNALLHECTRKRRLLTEFMDRNRSMRLIKECRELIRMNRRAD